jgi:hypothetical protein
MRVTKRSSVKKSGFSKSFLRRLRLLLELSLLRLSCIVMIMTVAAWSRLE